MHVILGLALLYFIIYPAVAFVIRAFQRMNDHGNNQPLRSWKVWEKENW